MVWKSGERKARNPLETTQIVLPHTKISHTFTTPIYHTSISYSIESTQFLKYNRIRINSLEKNFYFSVTLRQRLRLLPLHRYFHHL
jgi:hypothetical protein